MQKNGRSFNLKENVTFSPSPGLSEFASIKGGINHIKSLDTDPKWKCFKYCSAAGDKNEVILTYETPLPVYQDPLQAFTLHILQIDLNLAEHEVVRLGIPVADCQQLLQAGRVQLLWILGYICDWIFLDRSYLENSKKVVCNSGQKTWKVNSWAYNPVLVVAFYLCSLSDLGHRSPGTLGMAENSS